MKVSSWISVINAIVQVATDIIRVLRLIDNDNRKPPQKE